jgi:hypothetical protein
MIEPISNIAPLREDLAKLVPDSFLITTTFKRWTVEIGLNNVWKKHLDYVQRQSSGFRIVGGDYSYDAGEALTLLLNNYYNSDKEELGSFIFQLLELYSKENDGDFDVDDISDLQNAIEKADERVTKYKKIQKDGRYVYPLGRIITYKDYMLLSFTHFINNEAHQSVKDYEESLRVMWKEISRTYANKPIFLPLLGAGITRFDDVPQKLKFNLLRCMLCTLRTSNVNINQPITILLTEDAIQDINLYELKGVK